MNGKPELSVRQILNMSVGFLGIQFAFGLQNANVSRIFQTLGAHVAQIPALWIAAPLTGLLVQPIIGYASDRTWGRFGRRRPYFLVGAVLTTIALLVMPDSPVLWVAAMMLWLMDASVNVSMEPFRAFVADQLPSTQRPLGFALQTLFIGIGAVLSSVLPWVLARFGVANLAPPGEIPATVRISFYVGGAVLMGAVLWTVLTTREYPPERLRGFADSPPAPRRLDVARAWRPGVVLLVLGALGIGLIRHFALEQQLYLLASGLAIGGALFLWLSRSRSRGMVRQVMADLYGMPRSMRRLAWVQFFSWFAMFALWIYTTPAVTAVQFGSSNPLSSAYNAGANWVDVLFGAYNGFAVLAALIIPQIVRRAGLRWTHVINLAAAAAGLISFLWVRDPRWLLLSMLGVGFGWASILSLPYTLLADSLPAEKMGVYMGIFNFFVVIPQLLAASVLGALLEAFFDGRAVFGLVLGGVSLALAGLCTLRVAEPGAGVLAAAPAPQA
ncbi:MAG: MFS transporter [Steroidobacteraceae bacterium]